MFSFQIYLRSTNFRAYLFSPVGKKMYFAGINFRELKKFWYFASINFRELAIFRISCGSRLLIKKCNFINFAVHEKPSEMDN